MEAGARGIKNVTLELGGKSPLIIFNDARPGFTSKSSGSGSLNSYTELRIRIVLF
jgi:acyl-CoA reductase-like NAD-dependent aldehyde dehydrogenase